VLKLRVLGSNTISHEPGVILISKRKVVSDILQSWPEKHAARMRKEHDIGLAQVAVKCPTYTQSMLIPRDEGRETARLQTHQECIGLMGL
jgi:hypothetical protein